MTTNITWRVPRIFDRDRFVADERLGLAFGVDGAHAELQTRAIMSNSCQFCAI